MSRLVFSLDPVPPFRLDLTAWAIRRRPENATDVWDGEKYERVLAIRGKPALVSVRQSGTVEQPRLEVTASSARVPDVTAALERLLGLRIDLKGFYALAERSRLHELAVRFRGLKPPRFPTAWEGLVNGIACQQLSLNVGILLLNRLAKLCGLAHDGRYAFPRPEDVAAADPEAVRSLGFSGAKVRALLELGAAIAARQLDLESLAELDNEQAASQLLALRGVGRWTAEYVLLRGMGRIDVFPGDDVGARNKLARWLRLRTPLDYPGVARITERWNPYGGLIYFHLLLDGLERAGHLQPRSVKDDQTETGVRRRSA